MAVYGDFEAGTDGWYGNASSVAQRVNDGGAAYAGDWYWHCETPGSASQEGCVQYDGVAVQPALGYRIDCPINTHNASPLQIIVVYLNAALGYLGQDTTGQRNPTVDAWDVEQFTFTTPASCAWIRTYVVAWGTQALDFDLDEVAITADTVDGSGAPSTPVATGAAAGSPIATGAASGITAAPVAAAAGSPTAAAQGAPSTPVAAAAAAGTSTVQGSGAPAAPQPTSAATGNATVTGAGAGTTPAVTSASGYVGFAMAGTVTVGPYLTGTVTVGPATTGTVVVS